MRLDPSDPGLPFTARGCAWILSFVLRFWSIVIIVISLLILIRR